MTSYNMYSFVLSSFTKYCCEINPCHWIQQFTHIHSSTVLHCKIVSTVDEHLGYFLGSENTVRRCTYMCATVINNVK